MNRHPRWLQAGVVAAALVWLAGCSLDQPVPSGTQPPSEPAGGLRVSQVATIPAVHVPALLQPVAGTGTRFLIRGGTGDGSARYTLDNGRTWQDAPAELSVRGDQSDTPLLGSFIGYGGIFLGVRQEPQPSYAYTGFQRWDPATGQLTTLAYDLDPPPPSDGDDDTPIFPIDYIGTLVLLDDSRIFDVSGSAALLVEPRLPELPGLTELRWRGLARNGQYVVGTATAAAGEQLVLGALTPQAVPTAVTVPGLLAADVSADRIHYLVSAPGRLSACRAEIATPATASCVLVDSGSYLNRRYTAVVSTSDGATQVSLFSEEGDGLHRYWFVRAGRVTLMSDDSSEWDWLPYRDAAAPVARQRGVAVTISDVGVATPLFSAPAESAPAMSPAVAADRVVYLQQSAAPNRSRWPVWSRAIAERSLGDPALLVDRTVIAPYVSGDRTAVQWDRDWEDGRNDVVCYDGTTQTNSLKVRAGEGLRALSGPYARLGGAAGGQVVGVDGHRYETGPVMTNFGSLVVEASSAQEKAGRSYTVRDLARPQAEPVPVELPDTAGRIYHDANWLSWGEWVATTYETADGRGALLFNHRSGETVDLDDRWPLGLGDGWALLLEPSAERVWLRRLDTGEEIDLGDWTDVATDGVRTLAWTGQQDGVVARIEGLPTPVPRLLGALRATKFQVGGKRTWNPEFDLTAPTGPGTLQVLDPAGEPVISLPVDASSSGSLRGLSWDGRDAAGKLVEPGEYSWTLEVDGATSVDGLRPASGPLIITR
ncbi:MAG: FlgD immunoglobulin-like domain containing protein [Propionicimonas sp.]